MASAILRPVPIKLMLNWPLKHIRMNEELQNVLLCYSTRKVDWKNLKKMCVEITAQGWVAHTWKVNISHRKDTLNSAMKLQYTVFHLPVDTWLHYNNLLLWQKAQVDQEESGKTEGL